MNPSQNEHMHKKRLGKNSKEMLEKSKAKRSKGNISPNIEHLEDSDDKLLNIEQCIESMSHKDSNVTEDISTRNITDISISISEGEANVNLEGSAGHVTKLDELSEEGETLVEASNAPVDHLRAEACSPNISQSQSEKQSQSSIEGRDISLSRTKLEEFEGLDNQDYNQMTESSSDVVIAQPNFLNSMQLVIPEINDTNLQQKINILETTTNNQKELICRLTEQLTDICKHVQTLEIERETRNTEINNCKTQIYNLNEQIRLSTLEKNLNTDQTLKQQEEYKALVYHLTQNLKILDSIIKDHSEFADRKAELEEYITTLKNENNMFLDRLKKDLKKEWLVIEYKQAIELLFFQAQLVSQAKSLKIVETQINLFELKLKKLCSEIEKGERMRTLFYRMSQLYVFAHIICGFGSFLAKYSIKKKFLY